MTAYFSECPEKKHLSLGAQTESEEKGEVISRQESAFGYLFWGAGENSRVIVILGEMGKGEAREKVSFKSHAVFWICSDYSCRYLCWRLTGRWTGSGLAELWAEEVRLQVKRFEVFTAVINLAKAALYLIAPGAIFPPLLQPERGMGESRAGSDCFQSCLFSMIVQILQLPTTTSSCQAHRLKNSVTITWSSDFHFNCINRPDEHLKGC